MEGGAVAQAGRGPDPAAVRCDDGAADRQAHAHAFGFGGEQRLEHAPGQFRRQPGAAVFDAQLDASAGDDGGRAQADFAALFCERRGGDGLHRVDQQIKYHLLELRAVGAYRLAIQPQLGAHRDVVLVQLAAQQQQYFAQRVVDDEFGPLLRASPRMPRMMSPARRPAVTIMSKACRTCSRSGSSRLSQCRPAPALSTMADSGWLTSCAIEAASSPIVVTRATRASSACAWRSAACVCFSCSLVSFSCWRNCAACAALWPSITSGMVRQPSSPSRPYADS